MLRIESLLRREIGLDAASIGSTLIQRTVRLRMKALGIEQTAEYERLLRSSPTALEALIEAVVVTETWFFRDREPFAAFAQLAREWLPEHPAGTLRTLSVPCSSGEEPYSLAMALLDVPVPPHRFAIDGVDISNHALARARNAIYGRNSFRGKSLTFRDRYFRHTKEGYALNPVVRECVRFCRDNLLGEEFLAGFAAYNVIFCRNLLIYFDRATQVRALRRIHRLLTPDGVLFVGPAELPIVAGNGFVSANLPMAFACRKASAREITSEPKPTPSASIPISRAEVQGSTHAAHRSRQALPAQSARPMGQLPPGPPEVATPLSHGPSATTNLARAVPGTPTEADELPGRRQAGTHATPVIPSDLDAARQLADAGRLAEAVAICDAHLRKEGPSAQAYCLLGILHDASGDPKASDYYRKALYLEPNHYETLLHLSLLLEKNGDNAGARAFKRRAERAQQKPTPSGRS